jgi:molybdopterin-containing oxidoreductase family iron-sulfur binding subunit
MERRDFLKAGVALGLAGLGALGLAGCDAMGQTSIGKSTTNALALTAGRWGLAVDVEKLNEGVDFERITTACHTSHNVPAIDDPKTEVKWIWTDDFEHCFADMESAYLSEHIKGLRFPVLCNHCADPVCVRVCPTEATFQRPDGIVDMDYHRCIGCRFCMTGCPYNARSLNFFDPRPYIAEVDAGYPTRTKGVVEKCNFCVERLEQGLAPHCVEESQGCFIFGDLEDATSDIRKALDGYFTIRRRVSLGTGPSVFYILRGGEANA